MKREPTFLLFYDLCGSPLNIHLYMDMKTSVRTLIVKVVGKWFYLKQWYLSTDLEFRCSCFHCIMRIGMIYFYITAVHPAPGMGMDGNGEVVPHNHLLRVDGARKPRKAITLGEGKSWFWTTAALRIYAKNWKDYGSKSIQKTRGGLSKAAECKHWQLSNSLSWYFNPSPNPLI